MGKTLSFGKGKGNIKHNNRDYETPNVDHDRVKDNIIYKQEPIEQAYEKCYGKAIEDYNSHQKRNDRKKSVPAYMEEIRRNQANRNGEKLFYEQVIAVGDMHDSGILTNPQEAEKCKAILDEYMKEWQERNPNLYVFNAVLHMDEQTPHLHVDYIPIGEGYKQGIQCRNSLTKAFENMGIESTKSQKDNATIKWQERERGRLTEIAKEHGIDIDVLGIKRDDYTISDYKALVQDEKNAMKQVKAVEPKRVNLPFGLALETNRQEVDKALERKANVKKHALTYQQATKEAENVKKHATEGVKAIKGIELGLQEKEAELEQLDRNRQYQHERAMQELRTKEQELQAEKDKYTEAYKGQLSLNNKYQDLMDRYNDVVGKHNALVQENRSLKSQIIDLKESIQEQINKAIEPLKQKLQQVAKGHFATMKAIAFCTDKLNLGEVSKDILASAWANARDYMKEDGFPEFAEKQAVLTKDVRSYMELNLEFKQLNGVKGVYTPKGTLIEPCKSLSDAKALYPSCNITNKVISHDLSR